ncbi:E3 ubiquitin/ISG15 ligase TRIM25-like [Engraulis encrasicolus]|uniref:E3 ubiquitin/ISG15 ligase TRIM25-like n=1 Tax=Engraulis encrasicolus TaxID=184585 RepID=UPI002FD5AEAA
MAKAMASNEEILMCPICLDLLKTPATIPCGHSYCMDCITECWNQLDQKGVYSCPKCRETFCPRPALKKTTIVAELVEKVSKATIKDDPAGIEDVECDICIGKKSKAVRSCLDCLLSYCKTHLKAHNDLHPGRKHSIVDATAKLHERKCSRHGKVSEIFCRTDQSLICYLCTMDEHRGHDTVTAVAEWTEKQKQLGHSKLTFQQRIQRTEKDSSAQTAVDESENMFDEMIRSINRRRSEAIKEIRTEEKAEVSRAEGLVKKLEQEIAELKRREAELEKLSHTEDYIHILKVITTTFSSATCGTVRQGRSKV